MRVLMKKFLFIGPKEAHKTFFEKAQVEGIMEFISVSEQKKHHLPKDVINLQHAINVLKREQVNPEVKSIDFSQANDIVNQILQTKKEIENIHEKIRLLDGEIAKVHPLGEFNPDHLSDIKEKTKRNFQFFFARHERIEREKISEDLIFINREYDFDYFFYVGKEPFSHPHFTEVVVEKSLSKLVEEQRRLQKLSHEIEDQMKELAAYQDSLYDFMIHEMNRIHLNFAKEDIDLFLDQQIFGIEAWIPENKVGLIQSIIEHIPLHVQEVAIEKKDKVPTYLENEGFGRVGQDLVEVYDTPSTSDPDPSTWVIWSFAIFFAMIVADAGYGCLFLLLSIFLRFKFPKWQGMKKRLVKLLTVLSCSCIIWGVMIGSYFSIKLEPTDSLNKVSILYNLALSKVQYAMEHNSSAYIEWVKEFPNASKVTDPGEFINQATTIKDGHKAYVFMDNIYDSLLLEIALLVGVIHISLSFLRNIRRSWASIGWVCMIWGGFLFFPKMLDANTMIHYLGLLTPETSFVLGEKLLYGGFGLAILLSLIQEKWSGLAACFKVIEIFADTLSYLRLYALGLASMVLAATFNEIGMMFSGYGVGYLIILLGHGVNITLAIMAGVIHGLRLNFLEWYHHSFEGGGQKFNPLRLLVRDN